MRLRPFYLWGALAAAAILGYGLLEYALALHQQGEQVRQSIHRSVTTLADLARPFLMLNQIPPIQRLVANEVASPDISSVAIFQAKPDRMELIGGKMKTDRGMVVDGAPFIQPGDITEAREIVFDRAVLGQVQVIVAWRDYTRQLNQVFWRSFGHTIIALLILGAALRLIFQHIRLAETHAHARDVAESANLIKTEFLANMSHELRTPINAIVGFAELLMEEAQAEKKKRNVEDLKKIRSSAIHLLTLINEMLTYSTIESGKWARETMDFSVKDLAEELVGIYKYRLSDQPVQLHLSISPSIPDVLNGDPRAVREILVQMLENAIKFTPNGDVVLILELESINDAEVRIRFIIQDTGSGINEKKLERIFKVFEAGDTSSTRKHGGAGVGLAICKALVQMQGGQIQVKSIHGKGATFTFTLVFMPSSLKMD